MKKPSHYDALLNKIESGQALVGILGIGYVGRSIGQTIASVGYKVWGFDINPDRIKKIKELHIKNFQGKSSFTDLKSCDVILVNISTPLDKKKKPYLNNLINGIKTLANYLRPSQLILIESTIAPGTTREILLPLLEKSGLSFELDYFVGYSSERPDFTMPEYPIKKIPKVASGVGKKSHTLTLAFYKKMFDEVVEVSTVEIAEFCKMLENCFRFVNINLVNEMQEYAQKKKINFWEVIDAAKTKPFGFMPFYPNVGISGDCIPVVPYYFMESAKKNNIPTRILQEAANFHEKRIKTFINFVLKILKNTHQAHVLIIGVASKTGSTDTRESVALKIGNALQKKKICVSYHDPLIKKFNHSISLPLSPQLLKKQDLIILMTDDKKIDYEQLLKVGCPIIDTKNVYKGKHKHVYTF
jgi:UDP-N-acetyl-D-glucosamine dehydrogenase